MFVWLLCTEWKLITVHVQQSGVSKKSFWHRYRTFSNNIQPWVTILGREKPWLTAVSKKMLLCRSEVVWLRTCSSLLICLEKVENRERKKFREKPHADPDGHDVTEGEHLRWVISQRPAVTSWGFLPLQETIYPKSLHFCFLCIMN